MAQYRDYPTTSGNTVRIYLGRTPISTKGYKKRHGRERAKFFETGKHNLKRPKKQSAPE